MEDSKNVALNPSDMLGGLSLSEFNETIREITAHLFPQALHNYPAGALFTIDRLESALEEGRVPTDAVDVFDGTHLRRLVDIHRQSGRKGIEVVADALMSGSTIRVRNLDWFDGAIGSFTAATSRLMQADVQCNLYLTPASVNGFPPHFDTTDVFVAQCVGSKEWEIFESYTAMTDLPLADTAWDPRLFRPVGEPVRMLLQAADVLYVPRGVMHATRTVGKYSLHLTFSVAPQTAFDLLVRVLRRLAADNVELRRRVPLGPGGALESPAAESMRRWLIIASECADFPDLVSAGVAALPTLDAPFLPGHGLLTRALTENRTNG